MGNYWLIVSLVLEAGEQVLAEADVGKRKGHHDAREAPPIPGVFAAEHDQFSLVQLTSCCTFLKLAQRTSGQRSCDKAMKTLTRDSTPQLFVRYI
jgi:hypothetical protein